MEEDKTEKLKAAINKTFSSEDIEAKLKEQMQHAHTEKINNEENKIEEGKNFSPKKEIPLKKASINLPSINILIYVLSIAIIILLIVAIYLFVKKPSQKVVVQQMPPKEIIKEVKVEVEKEKIVDLDNTNFNKYYNALKFNTLKCYNFSKASSILTKNCKESINKFLKDNENSVRFEVIPVLAQDDNTIFEKIKPKLQELEKPFTNKIEEYILRGLSRERVIEATAYIRKNYDKNIVLTPTNYYVKSVKNNKGIIIKAYYYPKD